MIHFIRRSVFSACTLNCCFSTCECLMASRRGSLFTAISTPSLCLSLSYCRRKSLLNFNTRTSASSTLVWLKPAWAYKSMDKTTPRNSWKLTCGYSVMDRAWETSQICINSLSNVLYCITFKLYSPNTITVRNWLHNFTVLNIFL